jgi:alpha-tubulin suppressor-like RCC1 family protein
MTDDAEATAPRTVVPWLVAILVTVVAMATFGSALMGAEPAAAQAAPPAERVFTDWTRIAAGGAFTCGLRSSGRIYCWGNDYVGQLGNGGGQDSSSVPIEIAGHRTDWVALDAGDNGACARRRSGRLFCWGLDSYGQVGDGGGPRTRQAPTEVAGGRTDWTTFSVGGNHTCARRAVGRLFCWGSDSDGQLGNGDRTGNRYGPAPVAGGATTWATVSAGSLHTCARRTGGRLFCWGDDSGGQLGSGFPGDRNAPTEVAGGRTTWTGPVVAGGQHTCARQTNSSDFCWGSDGFGQLGNGYPAGSSGVPIEPVGQSDRVTQIATGQSHTCQQTVTGRLFCSGNNLSGQLGSIVGGGPSSIFSEVTGGRTDWASVSAGYSHTCALTTDHRAWCWGDNGAGQLGTDGGSRSTPAQVTIPVN